MFNARIDLPQDLVCNHVPNLENSGSNTMSLKSHNITARAMILVLTLVGSHAAAADRVPGDKVATARAIPADLAPFGDGYPAAGEPCRRLGESALTVNYLDDSAILVGCPDSGSAAALGGEVVGTIRDISLVSISTGDANVGLAAMQPSDESSAGGGDSPGPATDYDATAAAPCGLGGVDPNVNCPAGVKRNWGEDRTTLVEITKPDGRTRAIYFRGSTPFGADSAEADGSSGWDFGFSREGDEITVYFGPETYIISDAFVTGG